MNKINNINNLVGKTLQILAALCLAGTNAVAADFFNLATGDGSRIDRADQYSNTDGDKTPATTAPEAEDNLIFYNSALEAPASLTLYTGPGREGRSKAFNSMTFRANAGATQIDRSASSDRDATVLVIGAGGITMENDAGPVTFGRPTGDKKMQKLVLRAGADLAITNNSKNNLVFNSHFDGRSESSTSAITVAGSGAGEVVFANDIKKNWKGGDLAITIKTSGVVRFEGDNTYTGATNVESGKLFINGNSAAATGPVNVASGAALCGNGEIGGDVSIANNGRLEFVLGPADRHDAMELSKTLTLAGASEVEVTSAGGATPGKYPLLIAVGGILGKAPKTLKLPKGWLGKISISGNDLVLDLKSASAR